MTAEWDIAALFSGLVGGLALFLFGMDVMTRALRNVAGDYLRNLLARMTRNRFAGVATGAIVTAIIQSSSITTVLLIGFISAGLISTAQSVAVILGANIGTTITAQILAFKVTKIALPVLALGFFISFAAKREEWRLYGQILLGLGLVFFGMSIMSDTMKPLRGYEPFLDFMASLDQPALAAIVGAAFTAVIQSSSASTGILIVMAGQGLIGLEAAIAIALGANIGTCATACIASIGKPREAVRAALVHTLFNVAGVLIWIGLVPELAELARMVSPSHPEYSGLARTAAEVPRQIANVHTFFNVANAMVFIGFTAQVTRLVEWLVPDRPLRVDDRFAPKFIDEEFIETPAIALDAARREIVRLGGLVHEMLSAVVPTAISGSRVQIEEVGKMDKPVDAVHHAVIGYLRKVSLGRLSSQESDLLVALIKIANDLENIGDQVATAIVTSALKRVDENVLISKKTAQTIAEMHKRVVEALGGAIVALEQEDGALASTVRAMKHDLAEMVERITRYQISRLQADEPRRLATYSREVELIELLDSIFKTTRRIARTQISIFAPAPTIERSAAEPNS